MSSKRERRRVRRRAEKEMEEAWEAVAAERLDLAEKCSRRAVDLGAPNPRLWNDHGEIMLLCEHLEEAEGAFRMAIALAPSYADAFSNLARLQAMGGKMEAAERLQQRAVECEDTPGARAVLQSYRSMLPPRTEAEIPEQAPLPWTERTLRYDWDRVEAQLRQRGCVLLEGLLEEGECRDLAALFEEDERFEHDVERDDETGRVSYRFFQSQPPAVPSLRSEVYARATLMANQWNRELHRREGFPATLDRWLDQCRQAGQRHTSVILCRYPVGGFEGAHRDESGRLVFPLQLRVDLGPLGTAEGGGVFRLLDQRPGRRQRSREVETEVGDGILFCTRERLVGIAGVPGLQPVLHAVGEVRGQPRYALGIPLHDFG